MATNNVSVTHGGTALTGVTRFTCTMQRTLTPAHYDDEDFAQCVAADGWSIEGTLEGVNLEQIADFMGKAAGELVATCAAADDGGTERIFTIQDVHLHSNTLSSGEPGSFATTAISYTAVSSDGATAILAIT